MLDLLTITTIADSAQQALASASGAISSAFALAGVRWSPADSAALLKRALARKRGASDAGVQPCQAPEQLSIAEQFTRSIAVVETARSRTIAATSLQHAADEKLDAAEYALHRMLDELSAVMPDIARPEYANVVKRPLGVVSARDVAIAA